MTQFIIKSIEFTNGKEYPQGLGMTYDDIVVDCEDDEEIFAIDRTFISSGLHSETPVLRVWIRKRIT